MLSGKIVQEAVTGLGYEKQAVISHIESLPPWMVDRFCIEVLAMEHFYQRSVGKYVTEAPAAFKDPGKFYKIPLITDYCILKDVPGWEEIKSAYDNGSFSKDLLVDNVESATFSRFNAICSDILQLEYHYAIASSLSYTDHPEHLELKDPTDEAEIACYLSRFERGSEPMATRVLESTDEQEAGRPLGVEAQ